MSNLLENPSLESGEEVSIELAPFIDMLFIVLLFFLLAGGSSHFVTELDLPAQDAGEAAVGADTRRLEILPEGYALDGAPAADISELAAQLGRDDAPITLISDREASVQRFLDVLELLRREGLSEVAILTIPR